MAFELSLLIFRTSHSWRFFHSFCHSLLPDLPRPHSFYLLVPFPYQPIRTPLFSKIWKTPLFCVLCCFPFHSKWISYLAFISKDTVIVLYLFIPYSCSSFVHPFVFCLYIRTSLHSCFLALLCSTYLPFQALSLFLCPCSRPCSRSLESISRLLRTTRTEGFPVISSRFDSDSLSSLLFVSVGTCCNCCCHCHIEVSLRSKQLFSCIVGTCCCCS